jgi:hypothetical protein
MEENGEISCFLLHINDSDKLCTLAKGVAAAISTLSLSDGLDEKKTVSAEKGGGGMYGRLDRRRNSVMGTAHNGACM